MNSSLLVSSFSLLYAIKQVWCLNGRDLRKNGNKMDLLLAISTEWNCWENMFSLFRYVLSLILFHSFIQLACSCSIFSIISFRSHLLTPFCTRPVLPLHISTCHSNQIKFVLCFLLAFLVVLELQSNIISYS